MANSITAVFNAGQTRTVAEAPLYQWSYGQKLVFEGLQLPAAYQVDFSNFEFSGDSIPQTGGADGVTVPIAVLETGREVYAFVWLQDANSGRTQYCVEIRVIPRPAPAPGTPSPEEESALAEAITALNEGVEAAEDSAEDAEAWAVGERGGTPVDENDPTYHNNSKYYAEQAGTGGGGTNNYNELLNKPEINGVTLSGNKSAVDLGLATPEDIPTVPVDSVNGQTGDVDLDLDDIDDGATYKRATAAQLAQIATNANDIDAIEEKIPAAASSANPLADKAYVADQITQGTAIFRGSFASKAALVAVNWQTSNPAGANFVSNNDYAVVLDDETQNDECWRYLYVVGTGWTAQYRINESPLTNAQLAALNSGITAADVTKLSGIQAGAQVNPAFGTSNPAALGTAAPGSSSAVARADHVHPKPSASDIGAAPAITEVTVSTAGSVTQALDPGKLYHFTGALTALTVTLTAAAAGQIAQYHFDFDCGSTAPTVTIPNTVTMPDSQQFEASKHYEVDILNNYGVVQSWATS